MDHAARMARFRLTDLYVVITESWCAGRPARQVLEAALAAGVRLVQLREPELADRELYERARSFRELTARAEVLLVVDNRLDVALAVGADGVHLGQRDLPVAAARRLAPELIVGASTHTPEQARAAAAAGASYVNLGPIFPTRTKVGAPDPIGPDAIDRVAPLLRIPFTVMGGITAANVGEVLARGARHVAVVTAVTAAPDPRAAAAALRERILEARPSLRLP